VHDAGVVDQHIDTALVVEHVADASLDGFAGANVQPQHPHAVFVGALLPAGPEDVVAPLGEQAGGGLADSG
jgi:hypothetical protein